MKKFQDFNSNNYTKLNESTNTNIDYEKAFSTLEQLIDASVNTQKSEAARWSFQFGAYRYKQMFVYVGNQRYEKDECERFFNYCKSDDYIPRSYYFYIPNIFLQYAPEGLLTSRGDEKYIINKID